jgi:hypothetical protein
VRLDALRASGAWARWLRGREGLSRWDEGEKTMNRVERVSRTREIKAAGTVCMAAAWILFATPAPAQDANGMAQNGADLNRTAQNGPAASGAAQEERTGVARPDAAAITVTPYNDSDDAASSAPAVETIRPAKPSAAIPTAAPAATPTAALNRRATAKLMPTADGEGIAASGKDAAGFDPDATIVTEETAGRADRLLLSDTAAKENSDAGIVTHVPSRPGEVPDGTLVKVKLREELSTLTTKPGTSFSAEVSEPVMRDGHVVVPAGALLEGRVTFVRGGKRVGAAAAIHLEARTVTLPDGSRYMLTARVIDTNSWGDTKVDSEGTILRKDHAKATDAMTTLSTVGGMAAGAAMGGVPGAVIGASLGAGVSTAVWMRQDRQADLPKDLGIVFSLTEPMRVTPMSARLTRPGAGSASTE